MIVAVPEPGNKERGHGRKRLPRQPQIAKLQNDVGTSLKTHSTFTGSEQEQHVERVCARKTLSAPGVQASAAKHARKKAGAL